LLNKQEIGQQVRADIALAFQEAVVSVLTEKSLAALSKSNLNQLVVAGGVGANQQLRQHLTEKTALIGATVFYPQLEFCTDNGAMIALAGALRLQAADNKGSSSTGSFTVRARWNLAQTMSG